MNAENLRALAARVRTAKPEEYEQGSWATRRTVNGSCGTACCLAGHAALLAGAALIFEELPKVPLNVEEVARLEFSNKAELRGEPRTIAGVAAEWLGLDEYEANVVFYGPEDWPDPFRSRFDLAERDELRGVAADFLEALASGAVDLDADEAQEVPF